MKAGLVGYAQSGKTTLFNGCSGLIRPASGAAGYSGLESEDFHDLTGQRIAKVAGMLKLVEEHLARMMEIWSVIERFDVDAAIVAFSSLEPGSILPKIAAFALGGTVARTGNAEFGGTPLEVLGADPTLFHGLPRQQSVWMSHNDAVSAAPEGCEVEFFIFAPLGSNGAKPTTLDDGAYFDLTPVDLGSLFQCRLEESPPRWLCRHRRAFHRADGRSPL